MGFLHEVHHGRNEATGWNDGYTGCRCSYCYGKTKLHLGLNIPKRWCGWNSWYVIKYWNNRYIRWTNPWLKIFK